MRWIRIWTEETFYGSTFQELNAEERGIWFGLLVMAGLGQPEEGKIQLRKGIGYDIDTLAALLNCPTDVCKNAVNILQKHRKIRVSKTTNVIAISNWKKYQTEYERYRKGRRRKKLAAGQNAGQNAGQKHGDASKTDSDSDSDKGKEVRTAPVPIFREGNGTAKEIPIPPLLQEKFCKLKGGASDLSPLHSWLNECQYPARWILKAIEKALGVGKGRVAYVHAILEGFRQDGGPEKGKPGYDARRGVYTDEDGEEWQA